MRVLPSLIPRLDSRLSSSSTSIGLDWLQSWLLKIYASVNFGFIETWRDSSWLLVVVLLALFKMENPRRGEDGQHASPFNTVNAQEHADLSQQGEPKYNKNMEPLLSSDPVQVCIGSLTWMLQADSDRSLIGRLPRKLYWHSPRSLE